MGKERGSAEKTIRTIRRKTRRQHSAEEKIRIVMEGLRGEDTIKELCRREGIAESLYYKWSKEFLEDGSAGEPEVIAGDPECSSGEELYAMDGIALDEEGNVYALLVLQHKLVVINPGDGTHELLLDEEDGLWNGASLAFGTLEENRASLFITNYAVLPPEPENSLGPAVLKFDVGTPGLPMP
jgi:hypothetical protein